MRFEHESIDTLERFDSWQAEAGGYDAFGGVTAAAYDGELEFTTGGRSDHGSGFLYDRDQATDSWTRYDVLEDSRVAMGAAPADVDGDGRPEYVTGDHEGHVIVVDVSPDSERFGNWYRATEAHSAGFHDILAADIDGDGRPDIIGKSYRANWVNGVDGTNHVDVCWEVTAE